MDANRWPKINQYFRQRLYFHQRLTRRMIVALCAMVVGSSLANSLAAADPTDPHGNEAFANYDKAWIDTEEFTDPEAAAFDDWETLVEPESQMHWEHRDLKPIDWLRHFGFRHSSSHGRHVGKGLPLEGTSILNRPFHVDWFLGPLLGDELVSNLVSQENVIFKGLRLGWDFDYYWGIEWRLGWADPKADFTMTEESGFGKLTYVVSDIDVIYYPWGDSKFRPYFLSGLGAAQLNFSDENGINYNAALATIPFGGGVQFRQASWLMWRFEVLDNMSFGNDSIATLHNVSLTAGMELRLGARPRSYWPWRSSRKIW
jgi:hypothetical protein